MSHVSRYSFISALADGALATNSRMARTGKTKCNTQYTNALIQNPVKKQIWYICTRPAGTVTFSLTPAIKPGSDGTVPHNHWTSIERESVSTSHLARGVAMGNYEGNGTNRDGRTPINSKSTPIYALLASDIQVFHFNFPAVDNEP